jgi:hypothetical protein
MVIENFKGVAGIVKLGIVGRILFDLMGYINTQTNLLKLVYVFRSYSLNHIQHWLFCILYRLKMEWTYKLIFNHLTTNRRTTVLNRNHILLDSLVAYWWGIWGYCCQKSWHPYIHNYNLNRMYQSIRIRVDQL